MCVYVSIALQNKTTQKKTRPYTRQRLGSWVVGVMSWAGAVAVKAVRMLKVKAGPTDRPTDRDKNIPKVQLQHRSLF